MFLQIGAKPESDFTQPLGMLSDCHKRIRHFLKMLVTTTGEAGETLMEEQRRSLESALRYFQEAAPRHTADEEQSLFPRMRSVASSRVQEALSKMESLEADHKWADRRHAEVDAMVHKWLKDGRLPAPERGHLGVILGELSSVYDRHIALEETEIFPLANAALPEVEKRALGREMADRRGIVLAMGS